MPINSSILLAADRAGPRSCSTPSPRLTNSIINDNVVEIFNKAG